MAILNLPNDNKLKDGEVYSICLKGVEYFSLDILPDGEDLHANLMIFYPSNKNFMLGTIVSVKHDIFKNLKPIDYCDNCYLENFTYNDLLQYMQDTYKGFKETESITVLRFIIYE